MLQWVASAPYPGIKVRGHALFWAKRWNNPPWVQVKEFVWGLVRGAFPQELYGEDLVTAMTDRVNFTVNHYHQVLISKSELSEIKKKFCQEYIYCMTAGLLRVLWVPQRSPLGCYK